MATKRPHAVREKLAANGTSSGEGGITNSSKDEIIIGDINVRLCL